MRLSSAAALPATIQRPHYDRTRQKVGIVHFGIGAFHRAHQAVYTDDAMNAGGRDWGIIGVSLRSGDVASQLNPQDGLYTVTQKTSLAQNTRLIGAVQKVLVATEAATEIITAIAAPTTHIVSLTITEKGYQRGADGSYPGFCALLGQAFALRKSAGLPGITLLTCDNLSHNGVKLEALIQSYLEAHQPTSLDWFTTHCRCPSTMVDRIVPATSDSDRQIMGNLRDEAAVVTEPFSQWVIEDTFAGPRPQWEAGGAQFVADVVPYETAKLRMLNGAHSALAYIGLLKGHEFVHQAIADPAIQPLIERLMLWEAAPTIAVAIGHDLSAYAAALKDRFANSALNHRLAQIAMDGSQKIPQRWLETLEHNRKNGQHCPAIVSAVAAWIEYVRGDRFMVDDPKAQELAMLWLREGRSGVARALFGPDGVISALWSPSQQDWDSLNHQLS